MEKYDVRRDNRVEPRGVSGCFVDGSNTELFEDDGLVQFLLDRGMVCDPLCSETSDVGLLSPVFL